MLGEGDHFLGARVEVVLLLVVDGPRLERAAGGVALHAVHVEQVIERRDARRQAAGDVGRLLHAELAQDLVLDHLEAAATQLLAPGARRAVGRDVRARRRERRQPRLAAAVRPGVRGFGLSVRLVVVLGIGLLLEGVLVVEPLLVAQVVLRAAAVVVPPLAAERELLRRLGRLVGAGERAEDGNEDHELRAIHLSRHLCSFSSLH